MKKTRFIALVLAVSLMIMGSGYALWSETLVVNSKVNTGNLDIKFVSCSTDTPEYMSATANVLDKKINITVNDMYPGGSAKFVIEVTNNGTVPAKYNGFEFENETGNELLLKALRRSLTTKCGGRSLELMDVEIAHKPGHPNPKNIVIEPKESQEFILEFKLSDRVTEFQRETVSMDLNMDWIQATGKQK